MVFEGICFDIYIYIYVCVCVGMCVCVCVRVCVWYQASSFDMPSVCIFFNLYINVIMLTVLFWSY